MCVTTSVTHVMCTQVICIANSMNALIMGCVGVCVAVCIAVCVAVCRSVSITNELCVANSINAVSIKLCSHMYCVSHLLCVSPTRSTHWWCVALQNVLQYVLQCALQDAAVCQSQMNCVSRTRSTQWASNCVHACTVCHTYFVCRQHDRRTDDVLCCRWCDRCLLIFKTLESPQSL